MKKKLNGQTLSTTLPASLFLATILEMVHQHFSSKQQVQKYSSPAVETKHLLEREACQDSSPAPQLPTLNCRTLNQQQWDSYQGTSKQEE
jgi:hypothetical protein